MNLRINKRLSARQLDIMEIARQKGFIGVTQLVKHFGVTGQSIRRDLAELADSGLLRRSHGGATLIDNVANLAYRARRRIAAAAKQRIAAAAVARIPNDCSLFINVGTTTEEVARHLSQHRGLLVITNNLNVANILIGHEGTTLIVAGGAARREDGGIVGEMAEDTVARYKTDIAVIGASALDAEDGALLDYDHREVRIARAIIQNSRRVMLVADATKFSRHAPVRIGDIGDIDDFVTDKSPSAAFRRLCRLKKTAVILAGGR